MVVVVVGAGFSAGGPLLALAGLVLLDVPAGSREAATDFVDGGGWMLLAAIGVAALGVALYALTHPAVAVPHHGREASHD